MLCQARFARRVLRPETVRIGALAVMACFGTVVVFMILVLQLASVVAESPHTTMRPSTGGIPSRKRHALSSVTRAISDSASCVRNP